jgi:hypothetical protein
VDADSLPEEEATFFRDRGGDAERGGERLLQLFGPFDRDDPVAALPLGGEVGPLVGDQLSRRPLLAQLQPPVGDPEVGVALVERPARRRAELPAYRQRPFGIGDPRLQLDVSVLAGDRRSLAPTAYPAVGLCADYPQTRWERRIPTSS